MHHADFYGKSLLKTRRPKNDNFIDKSFGVFVYFSTLMHFFCG